MPVVLRFEGYKFFFFSNEGTPREPVHVHVRKGDRVAKFWIEPRIELAESYGMAPRELTRLMRVVAANERLIRRAWHGFFGE
ncbi:hypothetical protein RAS2_31290 [Phycisphaerae bacterium RAS2]|nr:hypothetical protein RAS2_31290 [Phycisphaerae bacterium RAS2]